MPVGERQARARGDRDADEAGRHPRAAEPEPVGPDGQGRDQRARPAAERPGEADEDIAAVDHHARRERRRIGHREDRGRSEQETRGDLLGAKAALEPPQQLRVRHDDERREAKPPQDANGQHEMIFQSPPSLFLVVICGERILKFAPDSCLRKCCDAKTVDPCMGPEIDKVGELRSFRPITPPGALGTGRWWI
jgi:hypothetical protein